MKLRTTVRISLLVTASGALATCGSRQPTEERQPPPVFAPKARVCPAVTASPNRQLTTAIGESKQPTVTWDGDAFGVAWSDLRGRAPEVRYQRVNEEGRLLSSSIRVGGDKAARDQSLAWDGKEHHMVFTLDEAVAATRVPGGDIEVLSPRGQDPAAGPWGAAVWVEAGVLQFRSDAMLPPETNNGRNLPQGPPVPIAAGGIESPQIAWNGESMAATWSDSSAKGRDILMQSVTPRGNKIGPPVKISATSGVSRSPVIAWTGQHFAIAWTAEAPTDEKGAERYRIFVALIPAGAAAPSLTRQLDLYAAADQVALASSGEELALAWVGKRKPRKTAVYFQRLSFQGRPLGETVEVTDGSQLTTGRPRMAWSGDGYGVVWHDDRAATGAEVFFSFLACGSPERDTDSEATEAVGTGDSTDAETGADTDPVPFELKKAFD